MNHDYTTRDKIIFGKYDPVSYFGGCRNFTCSRETMQRLINEKFIDPSEHQNFSPTTSEFMEYTDGLNDVIFNCYAISPDRDDYRITIEGFDVDIKDDDYDKLTYILEYVHYADEFNIEHYDGVYHLRVWWD